jgi:hypothetical protein
MNIFFVIDATVIKIIFKEFIHISENTIKKKFSKKLTPKKEDF